MTLVLDLMPQPLLQDYMGTEEHEGEDLSNFDARLGQCYFLAGLAVVDGDLGDGVLVHGTMHGRGSYRGKPHQRIGHGWVLLNTEPGQPRQVWEPIRGEVYDAREWYGFARAREERLYNEEQIRINLLRHRHWGRWHESEWP